MAADPESSSFFSLYRRFKASFWHGFARGQCDTSQMVRMALRHQTPKKKNKKKKKKANPSDKLRTYWHQALDSAQLGTAAKVEIRPEFHRKQRDFTMQILT